MNIDAATILERKRDGGIHSRAEIETLVTGSVDQSIADYQLTAWLMAAYIRGLNLEETAWLTEAMAESGERLDLTGLPKPWVDKHSTGGVGDKTSLVVLPVLASCGLIMVKMSGRGLGITGGTIDKLESIPGFRTDLTCPEMVAQASRIGLALTGQTQSLAPADKVLYALRDATATVGSLPLIVSSILSKKLAGGAEMVFLDVKCGSGAFMADLDHAVELANALRNIGEALGLKIRIAITDMSQPLGSAVGNGLEVVEALEVLKGRRDGRFRELCVSLSAHVLEAALGLQQTEARERAESSLATGKAFAKANEWLVSQGAPKGFADQPEQFLSRSPVTKEVRWHGLDGFVSRWDAKTVGECALMLGAGRRRKSEVIDHSVGVESFIEIGSKLSGEGLVAKVHAKTDADARTAEEMLLTAIEVGPEPIPLPPLIYETL